MSSLSDRLARFSPLVLSAALVACGGAVETNGSGSPGAPAGGVNGAADAGGGTTSGGANDAGSPTEPNGPGAPWSDLIFHIENAASDAINVSIDEGNRFRFSFDECDAKANSCGVWKGGKDGGYTLLPSAGAASFTFYDGHGALVHATSVTVTLASAIDSVDVVVVDDTGATTSSEWGAGEVCAVCTGRGPDEVKACEAPLPTTCGG